MVVVLNAAADRFEAARMLLDYGFARRTPTPPAQDQALVPTAPMCLVAA